MDPNDRLDPTTFFAARQEAFLREQLDQGATLIQLRDDGRWVARRRDSETVLPIYDRL
jgi:hypothetical protein